MKLTGDWLTRRETQAVFEMLGSAGHQVYAVGGCVRNELLGVAVQDVDMATDATPDRVISLAKAAGLKPIPTGIDHGTVTVVSGQIPHEVTSFRKDVATDGRRAVVAFSQDIQEDARRRDFTMNALYADQHGAVVDPLAGIADLQAGRVRFIDDPGARIREDYLRILRFFRFHAHYGARDAGMDAEALAAIATHSAGLAQISNERIGAEVIKLLAATDPAPAVASMRQTGVLQQILPGSDDRALAPLVHFEAQAGGERDPLCRLAALGGEGTAEALRLSKKQAARLAILRAGIGSPDLIAHLAYRHDAQIARDIAVLRAAVFEQPLQADLAEQITLGAGAVFPVKPADLMASFSGAALGMELRRLEALWIASGFRSSKAALLGKN